MVNQEHEHIQAHDIDLIPPKVGTSDLKSQNEQIRDKITHLLKIYPKISPSMMQIGIGSAMPATWWRPILEELIEQQVVARDHIVSTTPSGRTQTYEVLSLKE